MQLERVKPLGRGMRRHWAFGLWGLVGVGVLLAIFVARFQPRYRSETVIYHQASMSSERITGTVADAADPMLLRELLMRHGRLEAIIEEMGMYQEMVQKVGKVAAVEELKKRITFEPMGRSTFRVGYVGDSREEAQQIAARLAASLINDEDERRRELAKKSAAFLEVEVERTSKELRTKEESLERFITDHPEFAATALKRPIVPAAPIAPAPKDKAKKKKPTPAPLGPRPVAAPPAPSAVAAPAPRPKPKPPDPALVAARDTALRDLSAATRKLAQLQSSYTDKHPEVVSAKGNVAAAESRVAAANNALMEASSDDVYDDLEGAAPPPAPPPPVPVAVPAPRPRLPPRPKPKKKGEEKEKAPEPEPPAVEDGASESAAMETEWTRLTRAVEEARGREERLGQELNRANMAARSQVAGHDARVVVLDEAFLPAKPIRSSSFFLKLGIPFALLVAFALVLLRALIDDRIYEASDLVHRGLDPILSVVPAARGPRNA